MQAFGLLPPFAFGRMRLVTFEAAGERSFDDGRTRAEVELEVDGEGRVVGGSAIRPRVEGKTTIETKWSGSFGNYRRFGRARVPTSAEVAWLLPEGQFDYWRGRVTAFPDL